jgi:hypothetical protein
MITICCFSGYNKPFMSPYPILFWWATAYTCVAPSNYLFLLHQNQNMLFSNNGNQNIFLEKKHNPPPLQVKWSFPNVNILMTDCRRSLIGMLMGGITVCRILFHSSCKSNRITSGVALGTITLAAEQQMESFTCCFSFLFYGDQTNDLLTGLWWFVAESCHVFLPTGGLSQCYFQGY